MGYKRVRTLGDVARFGLRVKITCSACGRTRTVFASELYHRFDPSTDLKKVGSRLVCLGTDLGHRGCGHRGADVDFIIPDPPEPPDDDGGGGKVVSILSRLWGSESFWDHAANARRRRRG